MVWVYVYTRRRLLVVRLDSFLTPDLPIALFPITLLLPFHTLHAPAPIAGKCLYKCLYLLLLTLSIGEWI